MIPDTLVVGNYFPVLTWDKPMSTGKKEYKFYQSGSIKQLIIGILQYASKQVYY